MATSNASIRWSEGLLMSEPLVVIGNGMASMRLVEELARRALGRYAIAVVGEEPRLAYNRVLLSSVLAQEISRAEIELKSARWWRDHGVTLLYGHRAVAVDASIRRVRLAGGRAAIRQAGAGDGLAPLTDIAGMDLPGVLTFRDLGDVGAIEAAAADRSKAVVIGGGLLGLEAAYGLAKSGVEVSVVHLMDRLMERQLDVCAADMLKRAVEARGISVHLGAETLKIAGRQRTQAVVLKDGRHIEADLVVIAAGTRPNADLARTGDLAIDRGIIVDDRLQTSAPGIYAIGECAEHRSACYGLVEPAYEQASVLAAHLAGDDARYQGSVLATNLKVSGIKFSPSDMARPEPRRSFFGCGSCDLQEACDREWPSSRGRAVWRYRRRRLVSRSHPVRSVDRNAA
jgi:nitrite reductase (NADH) large subunit